MNTLGDALQKAIDAKKNDLSTFVWKGEKIKDGDKFVQESKRMIDMSEAELKKCYNRCKLMLYNTNSKNLGRYNVIDEVEDQINRCTVELLLRYYENSYLKREHATVIRRAPALAITLRKFMADHPEIDDWGKVPVTCLAKDLPEEFNDVRFDELLEGCIDNLGIFDKQHLTMTFITKMGLWFTKAEETELKGNTNSNVERLRVAKERLHLPSKLNLRFSEKGLSFHEMRAMLTLPKKQKYSDMTTEQLVALKNKVLLRYLKEVDWHIISWNKLMKQLEAVAEEKGISLTD